MQAFKGFSMNSVEYSLKKILWPFKDVEWRLTEIYGSVDRPKIVNSQQCSGREVGCLPHSTHSEHAVH